MATSLHLSFSMFTQLHVQWFAICVGTFVLEDAATVEAALAVSAGHVRISVAISALYVGVVLGDIGLYGLGRLATRYAWARRWVPDARRARLAGRAGGHVIPVVALSRFIPGARLPTYLMCGYLALGLWRFALASALATSVWTTGLFYLSLRLGPMIRAWLGPLQWLAPIGLLLTVAIIGRLISRERAADQGPPLPPPKMN